MDPIRWFQSRTIWLQIVGLVSVLASLALTQLPGLGLDPKPLLWWTLGLTVVVHVATWIVRQAPNDPAPPVGTKAEVEESK
jgi:fatty-acid desaturase